MVICPLFMAWSYIPSEQRTYDHAMLPGLTWQVAVDLEQWGWRQSAGSKSTGGGRK